MITRGERIVALRRARMAASPACLQGGFRPFFFGDSAWAVLARFPWMLPWPTMRIVRAVATTHLSPSKIAYLAALAIVAFAAAVPLAIALSTQLASRMRG